MKTNQIRHVGNGTYVDVIHGIQEAHDDCANPMLFFGNNHGDITETNYFDTESASRGFMYLSWNASVARLLVPNSQLHTIKEMRTGKYCVISRGKLAGADALEIMFEDGSKAPFAICIETGQTDRLITDDNKPFTVAAWTRSGKVAEWNGKYRVVAKLPCLQPWKKT